MKRIRILIMVLLCLSVMTACTKDKKEQTDDAAAPATVTMQPTTVPNNDDSAEEANKGDETDKLEIKIAALKGPTAIGMVKMMEDTQTGTTANQYNFTVAGTADEITAGLIKGDFDIAAVPCNLASVLYNKTEGQIRVAGINTLGVLYIVETGDTIHSVEDLKGKTIYSTGLGTTPQYTLNYILTANGIDPEKDIRIEYKTEATEVAAILSESTDAIAMLPQPYVTTVMMANEKVRIALDVAQEWDNVSTDGSSVVTGVVVAGSEFAEQNKEAFDAFMSEYELSAAYVNNNAEEASALVEKFNIFKAAPTKKAIPFCNITLIRGEEMKEKINGYLTVLYQQNPKAVGGKVPADDFYLN